MTITYSPVEIPLGGGIDTKTSSKLIRPPMLADAQNVRLTNAPGYETRKGYERIVTETSITDPRSLFTLDNDLLVLANDKLYSVTEHNNNVDLIEVSDLLLTGCSESVLDTQASNQQYPQMIEHQGLLVYVYYDSAAADCVYTIKDVDTGTRLVSETTISNSTRAYVMAYQNKVLIVYFDDGANAIKCLSFPTYDYTTTATATLKSDADADGVFTCTYLSWSDDIAVVYKNDTAGTPNVVAFQTDGTTISNSTVVDSTAATRDAAVIAAAEASNATVIYTSDGSVNHASFTSTENDWTSGFARTANVNATPVTDVACSISYSDGAPLVRLYTEINGGSRIDVTKESDISSLDPSNVDNSIYGIMLASEAFVHENRSYIHVIDGLNIQSTFFLLDEDGQVHAKSCTGEAQTEQGYNPKVQNGTVALTYKEQLNFNLSTTADVGTEVFSQYGIKRVDYDYTIKPKAVQFGKSAYISAGILYQYDGANLVEQGFHQFPQLRRTNLTPSTSTGNLTVAAQYSYRVYYEWYNAAGERQRSSSIPITDTLSGTENTMQLTIPTLTMTRKGSEVSIVVYRTTANSNVVGGAPFYRCSDPDPASSGSNGYLANNTGAASVTFTDELSDDDLLKNELDYQNTNELDHIAPDSSTGVIGEAKNRVWLAGFQDGSKVLFSKLKIRPNDQLEFHDQNRTAYLKVPEEGGAVTAIGALKHFTVIFKAEHTYVVSGEGPDNFGNGSFNSPQLVSADVGCIDQRSLVNIPGGLMFKSNKGIWIVTDNLQVNYIGAPVEGYNSQDITAATTINEDNHVIFLTSSGRALVFNYLLNAWTTYTNHEGLDAVVWSGVYTYLRNNGAIYKSADTYSDDGVAYNHLIKTAPIRLRGTQQQQKIRKLMLLGTYHSPHDLRVGCTWNYEPGVADYGTWDPDSHVSVSLYGAGAYGAGAYGGSGNPVYQADFRLPRRKCQSVQFTIESINTNNAGRAMSIEALQLEAGIKNTGSEVESGRKFSATGGSTAE